MRSVVLYGVLVAFPIAGTAAVMQHGRELRPAPAVGGEWTVDTAAVSGSLLCPAATAVQSTRSITITQSGPRVLLTLVGERGIPVSGLVTRLPGQAPAPAAFRGAADGLTIQATIDRTVQPMRLDGSVSFSGCDSTPSVRLIATRLPPAVKR